MEAWERTEWLRGSAGEEEPVAVGRHHHTSHAALERFTFTQKAVVTTGRGEGRVWKGYF